MASSPSVVVIDDTPANLRLLAGILGDAGYRVRPLPSAKLGLLAVLAEPPDVVLLDVDMPEMDGFEVCRRLKSNPATAGVPVIFVSAFGDTEHKLRAFVAGGVDYVTKPFRADEVRARVGVHVELAQARRDLAQSYERLKTLESLRDQLASMIVHDLRTPLNGMTLTLELLHSDPRLDEELKPDLEDARRCAVTMTQLVTSVLDVARLESEQMPIHLSELTPKGLLDEALGHLGVLARDPRLVLREMPEIRMKGDAKLGSRVIANLVINALSFVSSKNGRVEVGAALCGGAVRIFVIDNGPGIPAAALTRIFEKFAQVDSSAPRNARHSTGLGLTFCKMAVEAQGGRIAVESEPGQGSTFWFELPSAYDSSQSASPSSSESAS